MVVRYAKLWLEVLEKRDMLAAWVSFGPGGLYDGPGAPIYQGTGPFSGRVACLACPDDNHH